MLSKRKVSVLNLLKPRMEMGSDMCRTAKAGENDDGNEDRSKLRDGIEDRKGL